LAEYIFERYLFVPQINHWFNYGDPQHKIRQQWILKIKLIYNIRFRFDEPHDAQIFW